MNDYTAQRAMRGRYEDLARQANRERRATSSVASVGGRSLLARFFGRLFGRRDGAPREVVEPAARTAPQREPESARGPARSWDAMRSDV
ncbi:MAG: hypothetical protein P8Y02_03720 [Deinococcales bacterium]|jgi:hypothetical protein